jgi:DMSO/TMAO reductase YedYZ molybdopterin-dependent catalytic subunit
MRTRPEVHEPSTVAPAATTCLPPGQHEHHSFPRFGLTPYATRFPRETQRLRLALMGELRAPLELDDAVWSRLPRHEQRSDFHCVTTWSRRGVRWSGVRSSDVAALVQADPAATIVSFAGQDGYHAALPLQDLLAADVLLADRLDGEPLPLEHGAPLRLVAPAHYGYKSVKHVQRIAWLRKPPAYRPAVVGWMMHPRGRVAFEERARGVPGWLLRWLYRPMIGPTAARFERELARHRAQRGEAREERAAD